MPEPKQTSQLTNKNMIKAIPIFYFNKAKPSDHKSAV